MVTKVLIKRKGGAGSGNWGHAGRPGMVGGSSKRGGVGVPAQFSSLEISTYIDHGPQGTYQGKPLYTPGTGTITRVDRNAVVPISVLQDRTRVDIVRKAGRSLARPLGYISGLTRKIREEGYDISQSITVAVEQGGNITIIDGTHRVAAAARAGLNAIPAEVRYFGLSDVDHLLPYLNTAKKSAEELSGKDESASSDVLSNATATLIRYNTTEGKTREEASTMEKTASPARSSARVRVKGGAGSGNWGHAGRPGLVGGSTSTVAPMVGAAMSIARGRTAARRQEEAAGKKPSPEQVAAERRGRIRAIVTAKLERSTNSERHKSPTPKDIDKVTEWLELNPHAEYIMDSMKGGIIVTTGDWPFSRLMNIGKQKAKLYAAFYDPDKQHIVMRTGNFSRGNFDHEVGHHVVRVLARASYANNWKKLYQSDNEFDRHTWYSKNNAEEGFCEAYKSYLRNGGRAKPGSKYYPTFQAVDRVLQSLPTRTTGANKSVTIRVKGGAGSGNWGHAGRPGMVGGSAPRSGIGAGMSILTGRDWQMRQAIARVGGKPQDVFEEPEPRPTIEEEYRVYIQEFVEERVRIVNEEGDRIALSWEQAEVVEGWLAKHPIAYDIIGSASLATIRFVTNQEQFEELRGMPAGNADAFYSRRNRMVVMRDTHLSEEANARKYGEFNADWGQKVFHHEVGHAVEQLGRMRDVRAWDDWFRFNPDFDRHTNYSRTNGAESFAESYESFIMNEGRPPFPSTEQYPQPGSYQHTFDSVQMFTEMITEAGY